ncbi:hypothetical protein HPP92_022237 [Vanilla planifolia]|uniref:Uncharacterized protein n=1 Tax=Vanilla planifolia TaxID=51239 RepID=A0A835PSY7_VANPL|nr:hypothetical protein HPP92_022237 [Vanilla planifolia]
MVAGVGGSCPVYRPASPSPPSTIPSTTTQSRSPHVLRTVYGPASEATVEPFPSRRPLRRYAAGGIGYCLRSGGESARGASQETSEGTEAE